MLYHVLLLIVFDVGFQNRSQVFNPFQPIFIVCVHCYLSHYCPRVLTNQLNSATFLALSQDSGSLLKAVMGPVKFKFYCHLVDGCLMDSYATTSIFILLD